MKRLKTPSRKQKNAQQCEIGDPVRRQGAADEEGEDLIRSSPSNVSRKL